MSFPVGDSSDSRGPLAWPGSISWAVPSRGAYQAQQRASTVSVCGFGFSSPWTCFTVLERMMKGNTVTHGDVHVEQQLVAAPPGSSAPQDISLQVSFNKIMLARKKNDTPAETQRQEDTGISYISLSRLKTVHLVWDVISQHLGPFGFGTGCWGGKRSRVHLKPRRNLYLKLGWFHSNVFTLLTSIIYFSQRRYI